MALLHGALVVMGREAPQVDRFRVSVTDVCVDGYFWGAFACSTLFVWLQVMVYRWFRTV